MWFINSLKCVFSTYIHLENMQPCPVLGLELSRLCPIKAYTYESLGLLEEKRLVVLQYSANDLYKPHTQISGLMIHEILYISPVISRFPDCHLIQ